MSGNAKQRGAAIGESFRTEIESNCEFYEQKFYPLGGVCQEGVSAMSVQVESIISAFSPQLALEIRAMAAAANIEAKRLFALNARTEILNALSPQECTSLYSPSTSVLAQTWDWVDTIEGGTVLLQHQLDSGLEFITLTEAGIVGKIGFNNSGLGVCLNILSSPHQISGLPIHVTARAVLETPRFADIHALLGKAGTGKSSHLLIADDQGNGLSAEWAGDELHYSAEQQGGFCHSNHYLADSMDLRPAATGNSAERLQSAQRYLAQNSATSAESVFRFLQTDSEINHDYMPLAHFHGLNIGTVATIAMDLPDRTMTVARGPGSASAETSGSVYKLG